MTNRWMFDTINTHRPISTHIGTICKAASVAGLTEGKILYSYWSVDFDSTPSFWTPTALYSSILVPRVLCLKACPLSLRCETFRVLSRGWNCFSFRVFSGPSRFRFFFKSLGMFLTVGTAPCTVALMQSNSDPHMQRALLDRANF